MLPRQRRPSGLSDQQISEAFAANAIDDIAKSPYWSESAIIITYDETTASTITSQHIRNKFADGSPLAGGPRIPTLVISPYAVSGKISHRYSEHGSLIKFINKLKGLAPLATLPDERKGRRARRNSPIFGQHDLGPSDDPDNELGDLTEAFDYKRALAGQKPAIPASGHNVQSDGRQDAAASGDAEGLSKNGYTNGACAAIGVLPTDLQVGRRLSGGQPDRPLPLRRQSAPDAVARDTNDRNLGSLGASPAGLEGRKPRLPSLFYYSNCVEGLPMRHLVHGLFSLGLLSPRFDAGACAPSGRRATS